MRFGWAQATKSQTRREAGKILSAMRQSIFDFAWYLLFAGMRGYSSFATDAGFAEFKFQNASEVFKPVQENSTFHSSTGRAFLRGLRRSGQERIHRHETGEEAQEVFLSGASHRREHAEQHPGKSNHAMQGLPQEASSRNFETIVAITKHSGGEDAFYDIQVERICNFFAENILVHNCILLDDVHNTQEVESEAARNAVINWYSQSLSTRLNDPKTGTMMLVMQRQQEEDLTGYLLNTEAEMWEHVVFRMRYESNPPLDYDPRTEEGELLWPARMPELEVAKLEKTLGTYGTSGQLQQRPSPKGGGIIKAEDWQLFPPAGQEDEWKKDGVICWPPFEFVLASLDGAYTEKEENDPSAMTIWGIWYDRLGMPKIVAISAWEDFLSLNKLVMRVGNNCRKFKPDVLLIEAKASGISVAQEIQRLFRDAEWSTVLCPVKGDKVARAISVQGIFEDGTIYAPDRTWAQLLIDRCANFPKGKRKDLVDSTTQALRWLRDNGLIRRQDEVARAAQDALPRPGESLDNAAPYDV